MKNLTPAQIADIPRLKAEGYTTRGLCKLYNCHQTTINYWYRRIEQTTGTPLPKDRAGRPRLDLSHMVSQGEAKRQYDAEESPSVYNNPSL